MTDVYGGHWRPQRSHVVGAYPPMMIPTCGSVLNKSRECDPHGYGQQLEAEEEDDSSMLKAPLPLRASFDNRNVVCNNQKWIFKNQTKKQFKTFKKGDVMRAMISAVVALLTWLTL